MRALGFSEFPVLSTLPEATARGSAIRRRKSDRDKGHSPHLSAASPGRILIAQSHVVGTAATIIPLKVA